MRWAFFKIKILNSDFSGRRMPVPPLWLSSNGDQNRLDVYAPRTVDTLSRRTLYDKRHKIHHDLFRWPLRTFSHHELSLAQLVSTNTHARILERTEAINLENSPSLPVNLASLKSLFVVMYREWLLSSCIYMDWRNIKKIKIEGYLQGFRYYENLVAQLCKDKLIL